MKTKEKKIVLYITMLMGILILGLLTSPFTASGASKLLKIHYVDVGQADCILIQNNGSNMLIDAGNREDDKTVINYLKQQGVKKLDVIIGTHPHEDHIGGMAAVIKAYTVDKILMPKVATTTKTFRDLLDTIKGKGEKITAPVPGTSFKIGDATCTILAPNNTKYEDLNNYSIVIKLVYGKNSFMFDGDAEALSEEEMLSKNYDLSAEVLKLGHHGSRTSSSEAFLDRVNPKYAIISCGKGNDYGHPHDETIKKLLARNITFYRTDTNGNIVCTSDGANLTFLGSNSQSVNNTITPDSPKGVDASSGDKKKSTVVKTTGKPNGDIIVYITKSGKDYHTINCSSLKHSKISIKLSEAIKKGYKPHTGCKAPK